MLSNYLFILCNVIIIIFVIIASLILNGAVCKFKVSFVKTLLLILNYKENEKYKSI